MYVKQHTSTKYILAIGCERCDVHISYSNKNALCVSLIQPFHSGLN